jgi:hypothetical protein
VKIAIAQPTYLPWLGYFDLLDQADRFVFLDSVQFEKRSWQQRNRIKTPNGLQWLTVPVLSRGRREQRIAKVETGTEFWRDHCRSIELNYRRAPFFDRYYGPVSEVMRSGASSSNLATLTVGLLQWLAEAMDIKTITLKSSELPVEGKRTELLAEICASQSATSYLSPLGSVEYLVNDLPMLAERGIEVAFQHYEHPTYQQLFPPFQPYASALDLLFNEGDNALTIIRSGRRPPFLPQEASLQLHEKENS